MKYLIDSDRVVDYLKSVPSVVTLLERLVGEGLAISAVTYGEVYEGILFGRERERQERGFAEFLMVSRLIPLDERVALRYADLRGQLRAQGNLIADNDLFIAATAVHHELTLVTGNRRHFDRVPGLVLLA